MGTRNLKGAIIDSLPADPAGYEGLIYRNSVTGKARFYSNGAWKDLGSGTGLINYVLNSDAEADLSNMDLYSDAPGASPVDGTGGTANITLTRNTTLPLRGVADFQINKDAVNRQGQGVSTPITVDQADLAKIERISFDYKASANFSFGDGTYASPSDIAVFVYDVTNSSLIPVTSAYLDGSGKYLGEFQTNANSTDYRLIFHIGTTNASAWTFNFDNIQLGPREIAVGPASTDFAPYTPTFTGFGTTSNVNFFWKQDGDEMVIMGTFTAGTVSATAASFTLPNALNAAADLPYVSGLAILEGQSVGTDNAGGTGVFDSSQGVGVILVVDELLPNQVFFSQFNDADGNTNIVVKANGDSLLNTGGRRSVTCRVKIKGWSSNAQVSTSLSNSLATFQASQSIAQSFPDNTDTIVTDLSVTEDSLGGWESASNGYRVKKTAKYNIVGSVGFATSAAGIRIARIYVNGASIATDVSPTQASTTQNAHVVALGLPLQAGDLVQLDGLQSAGGALNSVTGDTTRLEIAEVASPQTLLGGTTVAARYYGTISATADTATPIEWSVKDYDTHGLIVPGPGFHVVVKQAGLYRFTASGLSTASIEATTRWWLDGAHAPGYQTGTINSTATSASFVITLMLQPGQSVELRTNASVTIAADAGSSFEVVKVG